MNWVLGLGGVALALIIVLIGIANFKFLPTIIKPANVIPNKDDAAD